jgi:hypothetical protein
MQGAQRADRARTLWQRNFESGVGGMKIWLDDTRAPPDDSWLVFRTAEDLLEWLWPHMGEVELMSLDHDLGEGRQTGYNVLECLEGMAYLGRTVPSRIEVHTANPVGRSKMLQAIQSIREIERALELHV